MKKIILILTFLPLFINCKYIKGNSCNNTYTVEGTYYSDYDKEAKNILIIKADGSFEQVLAKDNKIKKNNGTWIFYKEDCEIKFTNLKFLHNSPKSYTNDNPYEYPAVFRTNNIYFIDHDDISFFRKE